MYFSEGQINKPIQDDTHSTESGGTETSVLAEGIPEELGCEGRVLHPFAIPGVRFPTDGNGSMKGSQRDQMEDWEEDSPLEMEERLEEI